MSKVILTQEQADAVKKLKESIKANHERFRSNHQCDLADWEYVLLDIPTEKYLNAIFEGHEVEPEFEVGEYVVYENEVVKNTMKIIDVEAGDILVEPIYAGFEDYNRVSVNSPLIRHATPEEITEEKERRWWAKHGREPWELKVYDLLMNRGGTVFEVENATGNKVELWTIQKPIGKSFALNHIQRNFKVICFAENRLDVKDDE